MLIIYFYSKTRKFYIFDYKSFNSSLVLVKLLQEIHIYW